MTITNKTELNDIYTFNKYTLIKLQLKKFIPLFLLIFAAGFVILFIGDDLRSAGAFIILIDIIVFIILLFMPKFQSKSIYRSKYVNTVYTYNFEDEDFNVHCTNGIYESTYKVKYKQIYQVIEIKNYFFVFCDEGQGYFVKTLGLNKHSYNIIKEKLSQSMKFIDDSKCEIKVKNRK